MLRIERILCPVDFSVFSARAYDYAQSLARHYQAKLYLQHVVEFSLPAYAYYVPATYIVDPHPLLAQLEQVIPAEARGRCTIKPEVRIGKAYMEIIQEAAEARTDAVGVRGRNALDLAVFGSTTYRVIQLGPCPVLAVHV